MLSSKWKQIGHMSLFYCSRRVWCRGILRCRWWFFSLVSQTGCGKHNLVSRYVLLRLKAPPQHPGSASTPTFPMASEVHYRKFILDCKQTKVADDSPFPFCRCQKVRTDDIHNLLETQSLQLQKMRCFELFSGHFTWNTDNIWLIKVKAHLELV